ncbi:MAG: branched-chain amino acid ABC transporter permease [Acidimicrobiales bacterium]
MTYVVTVATVGAITAIFCLGVNVSWGWVGQIDLAYYAYVAVGAYGAMILELPPPSHKIATTFRSYILGLHWPFIPSVLAATAMGGVAALLVGLFAMRRLRGEYIAIITACTALMFAAVTTQSTQLLGGYIGIYGLTLPLNTTLHLGAVGYSYFYLGLCVFCLALVYVVLERLYKSPFGRSLRAVRENEMAAAAFGRNLFWLRLRSYALGGAVAAFGGALYANYLLAWNPASWNLIEVTLLISGVVVGGRANSRGVIIGSVIIDSLLPEISRLFPLLTSTTTLGPTVASIIGAGGIIVMLRFRPGGILREPRTRDRSPTRAVATEGGAAVPAVAQAGAGGSATGSAMSGTTTTMEGSSGD